MEAPPIKPDRYSIQDYLRLESGATERHEYRDGEIIAMAGGSPDHSLIIANVIRAVGNRLAGTPCRAYDSNLRVRIPRTPLFTYPDVSVISGPVQFDPQDPNRTTATNPRLIVEVLSKSTEADDRGEKFRRYLSLDSLQEYVLVSQVRPWVETFTRQSDGSWRFATAPDLGSIARLESLQIDLPLSEMYAGVEFPPEFEEMQAI
jgi:Uma2 family endonuclease